MCVCVCLNIIIDLIIIISNHFISFLERKTSILLFLFLITHLYSFLKLKII